MAEILVVEDDRNQQLLIQEELEIEGHHASCVCSGREALEEVKGHTPDVVVLDLRMPGMDGIELLGRLMEFNRSLPVIIHTAFATYKDNFMTWAADAYVVKRPDFGTLKDSIRQVLGRRRPGLGGSARPAKPKRC
jgi:DNA-binding response OmpR family regulator